MITEDPQQKTRDIIAQKYKDDKKEDVIKSTIQMIKLLESKRLTWTSILVYLEQLGVKYEDSLEAKLRLEGL